MNERRDRERLDPDPELSGAWWFGGFLAASIALPFTFRFPENNLVLWIYLYAQFAWIATGSVVVLLVLGAIIGWLLRRLPFLKAVTEWILPRVPPRRRRIA